MALLAVSGFYHVYRGNNVNDIIKITLITELELTQHGHQATSIFSDVQASMAKLRPTTFSTESIYEVVKTS